MPSVGAWCPEFTDIMVCMSNPRPDLTPNDPASKRSVVTTTDLADQLADVLNSVAYAGSRYLVTRHGKPVAMIVPVGEAA